MASPIVEIPEPGAQLSAASGSAAPFKRGPQDAGYARRSFRRRLGEALVIVALALRRAAVPIALGVLGAALALITIPPESHPAASWLALAPLLTLIALRTLALGVAAVAWVVFPPTHRLVLSQVTERSGDAGAGTRGHSTDHLRAAPAAFMRAETGFAQASAEADCPRPTVHLSRSQLPRVAGCPFDDAKRRMS